MISIGQKKSRNEKKIIKIVKWKEENLIEYSFVDTSAFTNFLFCSILMRFVWPKIDFLNLSKIEYNKIPTKFTSVHDRFTNDHKKIITFSEKERRK